MSVDPATIGELLAYDPITGKLTWKHRCASRFPSLRGANAWNAAYAGKEAFTATHNQGYRVGTLMKKIYLAHRVIWALMTGVWPTDEIDHINHDRSDNRWENLRQVTRHENKKNVSKQRNNTSGVPGVVWDKSEGKWQARIQENRVFQNLGRFDSIEEAARVRKQAEQDRDFHINHGA